MTKQDLTAKVASKAGLSQNQAAKVVEAFMESVVETVSAGDEVFLRGFGTFRSVLRQEKKARDISRGTTITIPATKKPVFKPSKEFQAIVGK